MKLSIQLYQSEGSKCIIIEVNRENGNVIEYHHVAKEILAAARNAPNKHEHDAFSLSRVDRRALSATDSVIRTDDLVRTISPMPAMTTTQNLDIFTKTMENIQVLLKKDRIDAFLLGMESLQLLTNGSSSKPEVARQACEAVLIDGRWQDVKNCIFSIIMDSEEEDELENTSHVTAEGNKKLVLALTIVGNSLSMMSSMKGKEDLTIDIDELKELISSLKDHMTEEERSPSNANIQTIYQAARCLSHSIDLSPELRSTAVEEGFLEVASNYVTGGPSCHRLLGDLSQSIVSSLGEVKN